MKIRFSQQDRRHRARGALVAFAALGLQTPAFADSLEMLPYALSGGTPNVDLRLRYENVDQDGVDEQAEAFTGRARIGYTTGKWNGFDSQLEFEGVHNIGSEHYNDTGNGRSQYPVIADLQGDELNQAWIRYTAPFDTAIKYGRQRIIFDNARFIGNVGWRQREQTYDATLITSSFIPKTTINLAQLTSALSFRDFTVNSHLGTRRDLQAYLFTISYAHAKWLAVTAYDYRIDFEPNTTPAAPPDSDTFGLRLTGTLAIVPLSLGYTLEYAQQNDYKDSTSKLVDADYRLAELNLGWKMLKATAGYELLGANDDGSYGFKTPLATLHSFQGWADVFLNTPNAGLEDVYAGLGATLAGATLNAVWHQYKADKGSGDFGSEWDLFAAYPLSRNCTIGAKYARYQAKDTAIPGVGPVLAVPLPANTVADESKTWLWLEYKF